jgi:four helix bundle protein
MATIKKLEDIKAWQKAREMVREIYRSSRTDPFRRDSGLREQICRAAVSAMTNIAEGFARGGDREFARFLDMARASSIEVQSLLYVARDVGYLSPADFQRLYAQTDEVATMIGGLTSYFRRSTPRTRTNPGTKGVSPN